MREPPSPPFLPAQTNTGLLVQMHDAGFADRALAGVQKAYRLACRLFNGRYRKTERAFICHAVGTGSSVARFDDRLVLILAGMLHAAYHSGQFPDGRIGRASRSHRAWLRSHVGAEVESVVFRYHQFSFDLGKPEGCLEGGLDDADGDLLLIALAHEVDDLADVGLRFAPKYGRSLESRVEACAALAERILKPDLAQTLRAHGRLYADTDWVVDLESQTLHGYLIVPNVMAYLGHRIDHLRRRFVRVQ
jgi:hypothetical protein